MFKSAKLFLGGGSLLIILTWIWNIPGQIDTASFWYKFLSQHEPFIQGFGTVLGLILITYALVLLRLQERTPKIQTTVLNTATERHHPIPAGQLPEISLGFEVANEWMGYITVNNSGATHSFTAKGRIIETRNQLGVARETPFKLKWANSAETHLQIKKDDVERIFLVELRQCEPGQRGSIILRQLENGKAALYVQYFWCNEPAKLKPEWDVEIEVLAKETEYSHKQAFRVSISESHPRGILSIEPFSEPKIDVQDQERLSTHENVPEILLIYDANLRKKTPMELRLATLRNTASTGSTEAKDAFDISVDIESYSDYQPEIAPIPRLFKGDEIKLSVSLRDRPLPTIVDALRHKADNVGKAQGKINPEVFLSASVTYRNSINERFQTQHAIHFDLWGQKVETRYIKLVPLNSQAVRS